MVHDEAHADAAHQSGDRVDSAMMGLCCRTRRRTTGELWPAASGGTQSGLQSVMSYPCTILYPVTVSTCALPSQCRGRAGSAATGAHRRGSRTAPGQPRSAIPRAHPVQDLCTDPAVSYVQRPGPAYMSAAYLCCGRAGSAAAAARRRRGRAPCWPARANRTQGAPSPGQNGTGSQTARSARPGTRPPLRRTRGHASGPGAGSGRLPGQGASNGFSASSQ